MKETMNKLKQNSRVLTDVLVLADPRFSYILDRKIFANRIFWTKISRNKWVNSLFLVLRSFIYFLIHRPKVILFVSVDRAVLWFALLKRYGFLPGVKLVLYSHKTFSNNKASLVGYITAAHAKYLDKIIVFERRLIKVHEPELRSKFVFIPLFLVPIRTPSYLRFDFHYRPSKLGDYIFSGGEAERDFKSLIEAVRGLNVRLKIVSLSSGWLEDIGKLPENCEVSFGDRTRRGLENFLKLMAYSLFVVVPIKKSSQMGLTTLVDALRLGKAVVSTKNASLDDYITDGVEGIRVSAGDVAGYREAILKLVNEPQLREEFESNARERAKGLTAERVTEKLVTLCRELLSS